MKYYMVEGIIQNAENMNDHIMKQHVAYTQKAMDRGMILISGLKADMSGGMFIMRAETLEETEHYLANEPFCLNGIQEYKVIEFNPHYLNPSTESWMESTK